jgi:hypothetical protein
MNDNQQSNNNSHDKNNSLSAAGRTGSVGEGQGEESQNSAFCIPHSELVYTYTRSQAIADGFQVEVSKVAREAGITYPVFLTRAVYDNYVTVPPALKHGKCDSHQDEAGRLWDIVWMTRFAILKAKPGQGGPCGSHRLPVALYVRNDNRRARLIKLIATCGPLDIDDPQPAITVMMPDED